MYGCRVCIVLYTTYKQCHYLQPQALMKIPYINPTSQHSGGNPPFFACRLLLSCRVRPQPGPRIRRHPSQTRCDGRPDEPRSTTFEIVPAGSCDTATMIVRYPPPTCLCLVTSFHHQSFLFASPIDQSRLVAHSSAGRHHSAYCLGSMP